VMATRGGGCKREHKDMKRGLLRGGAKLPWEGVDQQEEDEKSFAVEQPRCWWQRWQRKRRRPMISSTQQQEQGQEFY
jgi:hypothetical protein